MKLYSNDSCLLGFDIPSYSASPSWFRLGLPFIQVFPDMSSFTGSCIWGDFLIIQKCPGFCPLSIVTLSFSAVIMHVIVRSSCRPHFDFRIYFHSVPMDLNASWQSPVPVHFELSAVQWRSCCMLFGSCFFFIAFLQWGKENINSQTKEQVFVFLNWSRQVGSWMIGL